MQPLVLVIEGFSFLAVVVAALAVGSGGRWGRPLARGLTRWSRRPYAPVLVVALLSLAVSAAISWLRPPQPSIHDEFSYLLAADTFTHGRLTNPPHPLWPHFESFHIIQQPTYAAKYPPANGLLLAAGRVLGGAELVGVWLGTALAAVAVIWMLRGWVPRRWAVLGGLLVAVNPGLQLCWGQTYWGGAVAMAGGAVLWGAMRRLQRRLTVGGVVGFAAAVVVLLNSRPFEGLMASTAAAVVVGWHWWRTRQALPTATLVKALAAGAGVLACAAMWMAYYNYRVTGDPWKLPYQVHEETYARSPLFLWQPLRPAHEYRHPVMASFHQGWALEGYRQQRDLAGLWQTKAPQLGGLLVTFVSVPWLAACVALPDVWRRHRIGRVLGLLVVSLLPSLLVPWFYPHYVAPLVPLLFLVALQALRELRWWRWRARPVGRTLVRGLLVAYAAGFVTEAALHVTAPRTDWSWDRARIVAQLTQEPGQHVVLVRYGADHDGHAEWVYNAATIDAAKIVWARAMDDAADERLTSYFHDRRVWVLEADAQPPRLTEGGHPRREEGG